MEVLNNYCRDMGDEMDISIEKLMILDAKMPHSTLWEELYDFDVKMLEEMQKMYNCEYDF